MSNFRLVEYFKNTPELSTDVGEFIFEEMIGQGGNAHVLKFKKGPLFFAVKFLEHQDARKLGRLRDEFFSTAQLPTHPNVARSFHFDQCILSGRTFSLIVMRLYGKSLKKIGALPSDLEEEERAKRAMKLLGDLLNGLDHLHASQVIHRDLKPENVFFDESSDSFVIGDLGIAHFSEDFPRESETREGERLGNYLFSPKEQGIPGNVPIPANDLFSLGQVIQWFLTGSTHRGVGRKRFSTSTSHLDLRILDAVVDACLPDDATARLQSVAKVGEMIKKIRNPGRDATLRGDDLERAICMSYDKIDKTWFSTKLEDITDFLTNFSRECRVEEFCCVYMNGGDDKGVRFIRLEGHRWLLNNLDELLIENIIAYRDLSRSYRSFFIVLAAADEPFQWMDSDGAVVGRLSPNEDFADAATLFDGRYMDSAIQGRRYFKCNGETIEVTREKFSLRQRHLKRTAYLIVPDRSAASRMTDRTPMENLLKSVAVSGCLDEKTLSDYLKATRDHHGDELTIWD